MHGRIRERVGAAIQETYGLAPSAIPALIISYPPTRAFGDLAVTVAFELARRVRKAPRVIAAEIASAMAPIDGIARIQPTPNGYVNLYLDRSAFLLDGLRATDRRREQPAGGKAIVEHTAINPNKAAHIGHLRNAALGDTLVRLLRFQGTPVEVQNYIDDTGVQVADVVVGLQHLEQKRLDEVRALAEAERFDYYCWDLYARVTDWYQADRDRLSVRVATLHQIEHGGNDTADLAALVAERIVRRHLQTMGRMNVQYDLLAWEGDILRLQFWAKAFEILKRAGAVFLQTEGRLSGCWVMRIEDEPSLPLDGRLAEAAPAVSAGVAVADEEAAGGDDEALESREKVIVRSDGTVTYVGKDIAYQFWKFGLLGTDFSYRVFGPRADGGTVWSTTSQPVASSDHPPFGGAKYVYNVIDTRQAYLQKLLKQALASMGYGKEADRSVHFSYEMVALSHSTARELGYQVDPESAGRPFVEVSGRKGLGVKADDLLDLLVEKASSEVRKRNPDHAPEVARETAVAIATAAVRYFMIKYSRGKVIAFDIDEALSFEGESGPYLQYAAVRARNIFAKMQERHGVGEADLPRVLASVPSDVLNAPEAEELWGLVLEAARLDEVVEQAVRTLEPSVVGKYAFGLAQTFNAFYHRAPILQEAREDVRAWRAAAVSYFRQQIVRAIDLMGFAAPGRM
ncbi:MAG: arginine--tRNA ligase [Acidobacteria bacterium]|nr:arginine--tRNA ligase [Acidobacteriota bacterium]